MHLTFGQQLLMVFTLMLTSKGLPAMRASLVILLGTAASFNCPSSRSS